MTTYWVSFATDNEFLGVAIIDMDAEKPSAIDIVEKTIDLGCNPGDGSVQAQRIPDEIPERFKNRLLTKDEVALLNARGHTN